MSTVCQQPARFCLFLTLNSFPLDVFIFTPSTLQQQNHEFHTPPHPCHYCLRACLEILAGAQWRGTRQPTPVFLGFPAGSDGKESTCNAGHLGSVPGLGRSPRRGMQPTPLFLPGESHGQRNLAGYSPWGCPESDMT